MPTRQTESPALDYGEPLESFWKHSPSLLSQVQGIKLKGLRTKRVTDPTIQANFATVTQGLFGSSAPLAHRAVFGQTLAGFGADVYCAKEGKFTP